MKEATDKNKFTSELLHFAGYRYWTASLLPALVGTTLPFWLNPPGFSFKWFSAIEFLIATVFFHAGFSFLLAHSENRFTSNWTKNQLFLTGIICLVIAILIGLHINSGLQLNKNVFANIFILFGAVTIITGILYVSPPFSFFKRAGGEVFIFEGLSIIPILGAYLIQAGDLTRTVYIASIPIAVSTGLWIWVSELISRVNDEKIKRKTIVMFFTPSFSGRYITFALTILVYATLVVAILLRHSLAPLALIALLSIGFAHKIVTVSWNDYANITKMNKVYKYSFIMHLTICISIIISSLSTIIH